MEAHRQQHQSQPNSAQIEKVSASSYLCRQSCTRWTPTTEQIKLLKELYYINGVRSPTADQIQAICAQLRRYGKIEGKNVFYWFQNHKARERQKKRLISSNTTATSSNNEGINCCKKDEITKYHNISNDDNNHGESSSSSSTKENKFRDSSISGGFFYGTGATGDVNNSTTQWTSIGGTNYFSTYAYNFYGNIYTTDEDHEQGQYYGTTSEIETLPLFPMHNEDQIHSNYHFTSVGYHTDGHQWSSDGSNDASLELSLNSYGYGCYPYNTS
ncbi:hypothetical protein vseg_005079 [Gypsophila vaccaria]